jgi:ADP-ribosyl-[dinitrogen reductase] hydrolase
MESPSLEAIEQDLLPRIKGSMIGMAIGDALGASVEFRPRSFLEQNPVYDFTAGGTWGLSEGQVSRSSRLTFCLNEVNDGFIDYTCTGHNCFTVELH